MQDDELILLAAVAFFFLYSRSTTVSPATSLAVQQNLLAAQAANLNNQNIANIANSIGGDISSILNNL